MKFKKVEFLKEDRNPFGFLEKKINISLLVGEECLLRWEGEEEETGRDIFYLFPAIKEGESIFYIDSHWDPALNYSASGSYSKLISFQEGIALLVEKGACQHLFPPVLYY